MRKSAEKGAEGKERGVRSGERICMAGMEFAVSGLTSLFTLRSIGFFQRAKSAFFPDSCVVAGYRFGEAGQKGKVFIPEAEIPERPFYDNGVFSGGAGVEIPEEFEDIGVVFYKVLFGAAMA
jgi:hypothetical protein